MGGFFLAQSDGRLREKMRLSSGCVVADVEAKASISCIEYAFFYPLIARSASRTLEDFGSKAIGHVRALAAIQMLWSPPLRRWQLLSGGCALLSDAVGKMANDLVDVKHRPRALLVRQSCLLFIVVNPVVSSRPASPLIVLLAIVW